jgi:transcriptional regulator with XRE-family HTH domain
VHELRQFVQTELDARGWKPAKLAAIGGMHRQTIYKILGDEREHLGQMPDETTLEGIANGFNIPVERVRIAAARSLVNYQDDGTPINTDLSDVSLDVLFEEIRRRVNENRERYGMAYETESDASGEAGKAQEASRNVLPDAFPKLGAKAQGRRRT